MFDGNATVRCAYRRTNFDTLGDVSVIPVICWWRLRNERLGVLLVAWIPFLPTTDLARTSSLRF